MNELESFGAKFWEDNYKSGGNSGEGSYGDVAEFKAKVLNTFLTAHDIPSAIEYGCGDGHQLGLVKYKAYTGYDISPTAVQLCKDQYKSDVFKQFYHISEYDGRRAELALSLDVIYHIIEDDVFDNYMRRLFTSSTKYVVIYAVDEECDKESRQPHMYHRKFTKWVEDNAKQFDLVNFVANPCGYLTSFYIYRRMR